MKYTPRTRVYFNFGAQRHARAVGDRTSPAGEEQDLLSAVERVLARHLPAGEAGKALARQRLARHFEVLLAAQNPGISRGDSYRRVVAGHAAELVEESEEAVEALVEFLSSKEFPDRYGIPRRIDNWHREAAIVALGQLGGARAEQALIGVLERSAEYGHRLDEPVTEALVRIGDTRCVEALIARLSSGNGSGYDGEGKSCAVRALIALAGPARVVEILDSLLKGDDGSLRLFALYELGEIGPDLARYVEPARLIEVLTAMLEGPNRGLKQFAACELAKLNWQPDNDKTRAFYHIAQEDWSACAKIGAPAVEPLLAALAGGYRDERPILLALGETGDPRALEPILSALQKPTVDVSNCAADALGRLGDKRGFDALLARCESRGWPTQQEIDAITVLSEKCSISAEERSHVNALRAIYEEHLKAAEERNLFPDDGS